MATGHSSWPGSTPTAGDFEFGTLAIPLTLLCQCLSDETLKAVGPFYLVSSSSIVYYRLIYSTQCVGAMLWSMDQLRRGQLRMVVDVVGSC